MLIKIDQSEGRQMPVVILHDAAIAHLGITEDTLDAPAQFGMANFNKFSGLLARVHF
jgi:hypothetical protein